ncbi:retropepsin-like aspartic protease family protein [Aurantiacibacter aquimixticola]|uniref:TIGR02281 family clan AA aspartic protease n=1 Tax=Aurantiacibacter aquimixticola TaxID=1958945 RepID=A0A419RTX2_9SPHN|nr:TIGR02281 family clan AA aspartic protease [Aurantiacibacter aquimixticola]RJY09237.1 TIGR02281 family clan AA aspartic protease [Aurantiacibacter aquimixticola]
MDMRIALAGVMMTGGLLGITLPVIAPVESTDTADAEGLEPATETLSMLSDAPGGGWSDDVRLDRAADGHFYANVTVEGVPSRMLVDTGASVIALTGDDAAAMGLFWDPNTVAPVAQGASGPVYGARTRLSHVRLGSFEARNVDAMIIPEGLAISLLGQSFLSTIGNVQIADDTMVLNSSPQ